MNAITGLNDTEALLLEKFQALLADLDTAGDNAQYGHVLDDMDDYLFLHGRKFLTEILQSKTQEHINAAEQTAEAKHALIVKKTEVRKTRTKTLTTSNNHIRISRRHRRCNSCGTYSFPVEVLLGFDNNYTRGARRLIAFAVAKSSYETAAFQLREFGCITVSHHRRAALRLIEPDNDTKTTEESASVLRVNVG
jgi:N-acyl-D-aspartate/D-glutamate deacylase